MRTLYKTSVNPPKTILFVEEFGAPVNITLENIFALIDTVAGDLSVGGDISVTGEIITPTQQIQQTVLGGTCGYIVTSVTEQVDLSLTDTTSFDIPAGAQLIATVIRVDEEVVYDGAGVNFDAAYVAGATQNIATAVVGAVNDTEKTFFDVNAATNITSDVTNVQFTPDADAFDTGKITIVTYYAYLDITAL